MLEVSLHEVLRLEEGIVLHAIPELQKYWAFHVESGDQYELNESAYVLLAQFHEPRLVASGLQSFCERFNVDMHTAETDCVPLLGQYLVAGVFTKEAKGESSTRDSDLQKAGDQEVRKDDLP